MSCIKYTTHDHHVTPKHLGGTDDPENRIRLGDVCHTMWHWASWKRTGTLQERGAYLLLKGHLVNEVANLWDDTEYARLMSETHKANIAASPYRQQLMSKMGTKGGKANARTSYRKAMANHRPERQVQLCTQNQPKLAPLVGKWLTFEHNTGTIYTTKFDYSLKPIVEQMRRLTGKAPSSSRCSAMITAGGTFSGWHLKSIR